MRGTVTKRIKKFSQNSWDRTPEEQRPSSLKNYRKNLKKEWTRNPKFREFITKFAEIE